MIEIKKILIFLNNYDRIGQFLGKNKQENHYLILTKYLNALGIEKVKIF